MAYSLEKAIRFNPDAGRFPAAPVAEQSPLAIDFELHTPESQHRDRLESCIAETYQSAYQARIAQFLPLLLGMNIAEQPLAVVGFRPGFCRPMFLEHYLDLPVEQEVAAVARCPVDRASIVEIGNLVSTRKGGSQTLFVIMTAALEQAGYQWLVYTATPQVQKLVRRFGVEMHYLANAEAERLGLEAEDWGSYYATRPRVMACNIGAAMAVVRGNSAVRALLVRYSGAVDSLAQSLRDHRRLRERHH